MLFCQCCTSVVLSMFHWCCFVCVSLVFFLVAVCASPVLFYLCCTSGFFLCSTSVVLSVSLVLFWLWVLVLFWLCSNSVVLSVLLVVVFFCISLVFFLSVSLVMFCLCFTGVVLSYWKLLWSSLLKGEIAEQRYISLCNYNCRRVFFCNEKMILDMFLFIFLIK